MHYALLLPAATLLGSIAAGDLISPSETAPLFPEDYREWVHVKSEVILPGHKFAAGIMGIHHIYANEEALQGYETGDWPDGATLVFDLFSYKEVDNALIEDERKQVDVMIRSTNQFSATGNWGYEEFVYADGVQRRVVDMATQCHGCHSGADGGDFVFSDLRR